MQFAFFFQFLLGNLCNLRFLLKVLEQSLTKTNLINFSNNCNIVAYFQVANKNFEKVRNFEVKKCCELITEYFMLKIFAIFVCILEKYDSTHMFTHIFLRTIEFYL